MRLQNLTKLVLLVVLLPAVFAGPAQAQTKAELKRQAAARTAQQQLIHPKTQVLDVNNMTTWVQNDAWFGWIDPFTGENGSFPKGLGWATFSQGFLWGGKVQDGKAPVIRVNGSTYASGLKAGRILSPGVADDASDLAKYHVWRVRRDYKTLDYAQPASYFFGVPLEEVTEQMRQQVREQYEYDWMNWPAAWGAPFEDVDEDGVYDPSVDIPGYPGATQTLWLVANDLGSGTSENSYGSPAIGMEYQLTLWGYDFPATSPLGNLSFQKSRLIYKGTADTPPGARIDSMFVVQWADPDVGTYSNDYAGTDTTLSLGYAYNAPTTDDAFAQFGLAPPAVGWDFLQGPVTADGDTLGMTAFVYFAAGSDVSDPTLQDYEGTLEFFNLMRGLRPQPPYPASDPFINPLTGEPSKFTLTGDPVTGSGWIDGLQLPPGDRRIVLASGPFTMELGDTTEVVVGHIGGLGASNLSSVTVLKYHDQFAQFAYDNDFQLPSPPSVPPVNVTELDNQVILNWGFDRAQTDSIESSESRGFEFEGYNVYQLPSANAQLSEGVKVATFDKENLVSTIFDNVIDEESGFVVQRPVQLAPNEGLQRFLLIERDHIRNRPLANGVTYYYALTSYSYIDDEESPFRILESTPVTVSATPQPPRPGVTNVPELGELAVEQIAGAGDATIVANVVDPEQVVDATWTVTFDTTGGPHWNLLRDGTVVLANQPFGITTENPLLDGIQVSVADVTFAEPTTILNDFAVVDEGDDLHLWGDATLFGAPVGYYDAFTGGDFPALEDLYPDLEFRFTGNGGMEAPTTSGGQLATYWERAAFAATDLSGLESEVIRMPFELWDIENDRQVNFAVIGRNADGESPWGDGVGEYYRMSARDYIVPIMTEYDEAAVQAEGTSPLDPNATWLLFFLQGGDSVWETGDVYQVQFANPVVADVDAFEFGTTALQTGDPASLAGTVEEIGVFPNPYFGFSQLETNRFSKFVTFTRLPERATIRIFTLSGTMVRIIEHESSTQFATWDLTNQDNIPVASGVYLVHVDTPDGEKVLKLALVQEEQILQRY